MTEADTKTKGKGKGGPRQPHTRAERALALSVVKLCNGNVEEASRQTGVKRTTLYTWLRRQGENGEVTNPNQSLDEKLEGMIDALLMAGLQKVKDASLSECRELIDTMLDQREKLRNSKRLDASAEALRESLNLPKEKAAKPQTVDATLKAEWESHVVRLMQQAEADGKPVTREKAVAAIIRARPEAAGYLN